MIKAERDERLEETRAQKEDIMRQMHARSSGLPTLAELQHRQPEEVAAR